MTISTVRVPSVQCVAFKEESDSRKNFPSGDSFHAFCRQRDLFCALVRDRKSNKCGLAKLTKQCQLILGMSVGAASFLHLARLIIKQLITSCTSQEISYSPDPTTPEEVRQNPIEKLDKLNKRMSTPLHVGNPGCQTPIVRGLESFFHEFVTIADSASLNQHLVDHLKPKIEELNETEITNDLESGISTDTKEWFWSTLVTLQILGRFLGLIMFLPYREKMGTASNCGSKARSVCTPLDMVKILDEAKDKGRLVLSIPWITEYMTMMDSAAPELEYYNIVLSKLIWIYRNSNHIIPNAKIRLFLQLKLGTLFEMPTFPQTLFFLSSIRNTMDYNLNSLTADHDSLDLIEYSHISSCFSYASEIRVLMTNCVQGIRRGAKEIRKITPVSANECYDSSLPSENVQLQKELEDNFFHLQSSSVKRMVEYVAEQVSNKAVKQIKRTTVPQTILNITEKTKPELKEKDLDSLTYRAYHLIINEGNDFARGYCEKVSSQTITLLTPEDTSEEIISICSKIACRMAVNKVTTWMKSLINTGYLAEELSSHLKQKMTENESSNCDTELQFSLAGVIGDITDSLCSLHCDDEYTTDNVLELLKELRSLVASDCKISASISQRLKVLTVDWAVAMVVHHPLQVDDSVTKEFLDLWYIDFKDTTIGLTLLSPRNIQLLNMSSDPDQSWSKFGDLCCQICHHAGFVPILGNCSAVILVSWQSDVTKRIKHLLKKLLDEFESKDDELIELKKWTSSQQP